VIYLNFLTLNSNSPEDLNRSIGEELNEIGKYYNIDLSSWNDNGDKLGNLVKKLKS